MKKITIIFLTLFISCQNDDGPNIDENKEFLVSKVFDYQNRLLAEYIYNEENQLTRRIFTDPETGNSSDLVFNYINNKVNEVKYIDYTFPEFSNSILIYYNDLNRIIRSEVLKNGNILSHVNYEYYSNGRLKHLFPDNSSPLNLYEYDNNGNVHKVTHYYTDPTTGNISEQISRYSYDINKKPSFNLDYIIQIDLIPKMGGIGILERNISSNNMTIYDNGKTKLSYIYNENGLPISILTEWENVTTQEPMLLKIEYIEK
ncbi:hypothetical protein [Aquimarina megaterium]|uniref:hypothetical protein n=1 Tax=Aquimarina megaterium TaxID=1443666 RepID=UPI00094525E4|nr:hypothetical protein [Aquimarina megaterium]